MRKLYVGFSYPREFKIGAKAIAWWSSVDYSHVYLRFDSQKIPSSVYHAAHGMVHFREYGKFMEENKVIKEYEIEVSDADYLKTLIRCMLIAGDKYGFSELFKILSSDIAYSVFKKELQFENGKGYICSELVGELCKDVLQLKFNKPLYLLKPLDIDQNLKANGFILRKSP